MPPVQESRDSTNASDDIDDEQLEPPVTMELGFNKVIVVDNIPIVPQEKFEKLFSVIMHLFSAIAKVKQLVIPQDSKKMTKGFAFIEFYSPEDAEIAIEKTDGYNLDKNHVFRVNAYDDFEKYALVPDEYVVPEVKPYSHRENLKSWLEDPRDIDQYVVLYGEFTEVLWNDLKPGEDPESVVKRERWTDAYVAWSPRGTYLLTVHSRGVALWGGPEWEKINRFIHPEVKFVDFSPCEKYLVTASPQWIGSNDNPKDPQCIIVWDIRSGKKLRGFASSNLNQWPIFKWSHDDKYFARIADDMNMISVYETPSMELLEKKSIKIPGVKSFSWSPNDYIISYFVPESNNNNKPATVVLLEIPSKKERRQKNLFNVIDCKMYWHPQGTYLCVKVDRQKKKSSYTNFELFRIYEKDIPTELLEIKEAIVDFAWEPKGNRFAIIYGESPRPDISFYIMEKQVRHIKTLEKRCANQLVWSPQGNFIVLAGLQNLSGTLEFFNVDDMETMGNEEHMMASVVNWDPTGRYVSSVVSRFRQQLENGYNIYSFQGKLLKHVLKDEFYQLLWRPRPPSLLSEERLKQIKKNIKGMAKEMKEKDNAKKKALKEERQRKRNLLREEFMSYLNLRRKEYEEEQDKRREICDGEDPNIDEPGIVEEREEWIEELEDSQDIIVE